MGRRHHETEGVWRPCLTLLLITFISCAAVYMAVSSLFTPSGASDQPLNSTFINPQLVNIYEPECCKGIDHQELWGKAVKWGSDFKVNTSEQCCHACKSMCTDDGPCLCNSWVFCGDRKRCADRFGQCWLKKQEDPLSPEVQESGSQVEWTSGLIYGKGVGIVALETQYGTMHIKLFPNCAPLSVAYILELIKVRHCAGCQFYRAEGRASNWDVEGNRILKSPAGPPYALLQGTLEAEGTSFKEIPKEACPTIKKGAVAWIGGGPDFFISLANHDEWSKKYTVFASVLPEDMAVVEKIVDLPTTSAMWGGIKVAVLEKYISLRVKRPVDIQTQLSSSEGS
eukprot:Gb_24866 [translate_table: standard]